MSHNDLLNLAHGAWATANPHEANDLALRLSMAASDLTAIVGAREAGASARKGEIAQEYMDGAHLGGVALKATPAEDAAKKDPRWVLFQTETTELKATREQLIAHAQYFRARCTMLTQDREVARV